MATQFIKSVDIDVFPAVHRIPAYAISKRTTEDNLTKFGKLSSNKDNLSQMFKDPDAPLYVIFNIAGYWFRCLEAKIPSAANLYAYIALRKDPNIGYILTPADSLTLGGPLDAIVGADTDKSFKGLAFDDHIPSNVGVLYYGLQIRDSVGDLIYQNLKLDASEIRNTAGDDTKQIGEEFDTVTLTAQTINGLNIEATGNLTVAGTTTINSTTDSTSPDTGALVVEGGVGIEKKLWVGDTINDATIETNEITLASGKSLTIEHAGLKVGDLAGTGTVTI